MNTTAESLVKQDEKKDFLPEEFTRAKTVCDFVIELTKAISRSGYYDAHHPVSQEAKKGLYTEFQKALGASTELMLTCHEAGDKVDIHISGILDEPFNIKKLTKENTLDLFVPKLKDYFERKNLNSFVIKKYITLEHFESFIDVMSEPIPESADVSRLGEYLTKALTDLDITEVSTIFKTDIILSRGKLPWRVSIILRRLAKDLKVLPMFRSTSEDKMKLVKRQIVGDIIRPLHSSDLVRDLIINGDVIVQHLTHLMEIDELEKLMIDSVPQDAIVPVSQSVFAVYQKIKNENSFQDDALFEQRSVYLAKVLNIATQRIISENLPDAMDLFEQLYENKIVDFYMLPEKLRRDIQNKKMGGEIIAHIDEYIRKAAEASSNEERENYTEKFKTVMPEFVLRRQWPVIDRIIKVLDDYSLHHDDPSKQGTLSNYPDDVFGNCEVLLADEYIQADQDLRNHLNHLMLSMTSAFIKVIDIILNKSKEPHILKSVTELLSKKGELARQWSMEILQDQSQPLSILNIALLVIVHVGQSDDLNTVKKYVRYPNPSIKIKAIIAITKLNKKEAEGILIDALQDEEEKVRSQALNVLEHEVVVSGDSLRKLLSLVKEKNSQKDMKFYDAAFIGSLIRTVGKTKDSDQKENVETEIIHIASEILKERKGFLKLIKSDLSREQLEILSACIISLSRVGGKKSREFLKTFLKMDEPLSHLAHAAMTELDQK